MAIYYLNFDDLPTDKLWNRGSKKLTMNNVQFVVAYYRKIDFHIILFNWKPYREFFFFFNWKRKKRTVRNQVSKPVANRGGGGGGGSLDFSVRVDENNHDRARRRGFRLLQTSVPDGTSYVAKNGAGVPITRRKKIKNLHATIEIEFSKRRCSSSKIQFVLRHGHTVL